MDTATKDSPQVFPAPAHTGSPTAARAFPSVSTDRIVATGYDFAVSNMTFLTEMLFEHRLDPDRLCRALELLFQCLPILGCRFVPRFWQPRWEQLPWSPEAVLTVTGDPGRLERFKNEELPARTGPQVQACLYAGPRHDRLLVKCSHQLCDARRFNHVLFTLSSIYTRLASEPGFVPQRDTAYRGAREVFARIPLRAWPRILRNTARHMRQEQAPCLALRQPEEPDARTCHALRHVPAPRVHALREYARSRGATVTDMLLAAYFRTQIALAGWSGKSDLRICYTVDLQPWLEPGQPGFPVTNMVGLEYAFLGREPGADFVDTLRLVHMATESRKQDWYGLSQACFLPLWKYLPFRLQAMVLTGLMRRQVAAGTFPNLFSNVGRFPEQVLCFDRPPERAWSLPPVQYPPGLILGAATYRDEMTLTTGIRASARPFAETLFDRLLQELPV